MQYLNAPEGGYVFIVTYGRSGSTLLQNVLNHIDGYCIRGENSNTLASLARAWNAVDQDRVMQRLRRQKTATAPSDPWYGAENVDPAQYGRMLADTFVRAILQPGPDTRVAGFKEIRFHHNPEFFNRYMTFMRRFFPKARFVFNTRDHAAVARSGWWAQQDAATVIAKLERAEQLYAAAAERFPRRSLRLCYDDYNGNPEALRPLFDFLGEPFDGDMVARVLARRLDHLQAPAATARE